MVALPISNSAEGGTNGTTVTTGNSGGGSGDAFSAVNIGTTGAVTFDSSASAHGGLSYAFSTGATSALANGTWSLTSAQATVYWRVYIRISGANASQNVIRMTAGGTQSTRVAVNS